VFSVDGSQDKVDSFTYAKVVRGSVENSIHLRVGAEWNAVPGASNQAVGVVTGVGAGPGDIVSAGTVLYSVNLRPVAVARGEVPAFRDLSIGTVGADVEQLQRFLSESKLYDGSVDGRFGAATEGAVMHWQRRANLPEDGVVRVADIIFLPRLPARIVLKPEYISRGNSLIGGEAAVTTLTDSPDFVASISAAMAADLSRGTLVSIRASQTIRWKARTGEQTANDDGTLSLHLESAESGPICETSCNQVPAGKQTSFQADAITLPHTRGLVVPVTAISTTAAGQSVVVDDSGRVIPIKVIVSAKGQSIVEGVKTGTRVRIGHGGDS
jgi:peptidoglycan hydrolase-like protein with peptidoglycan-binding domain